MGDAGFAGHREPPQLRPPDEAAIGAERQRLNDMIAAADAAIEQLPVRCGQEVARVLTGRMPKNLFNPKVLDKLLLKAD